MRQKIEVLLVGSGGPGKSRDCKRRKAQKKQGLNKRKAQEAEKKMGKKRIRAYR
jgi:hypothetical protein